MLAGKGNVQGMFTFALVGHDMLTLILVGPADEPRFFSLSLSAGTTFGLLEFDLLPM